MTLVRHRILGVTARLYGWRPGPQLCYQCRSDYFRRLHRTGASRVNDNILVLNRPACAWHDHNKDCGRSAALLLRPSYTDLPDNNIMCSYTKPLTTIISSGCHATVIFILQQGYSWLLPAILLKATTSKIWMSLLLITLMIVFSKSMYFPVTRVNLCVFPFTRGNSFIFKKNWKINGLWAPWISSFKNLLSLSLLNFQFL